MSPLKTDQPEATAELSRAELSSAVEGERKEKNKILLANSKELTSFIPFKKRRDLNQQSKRSETDGASSDGASYALADHI